MNSIGKMAVIGAGSMGAAIAAAGARAGLSVLLLDVAGEEGPARNAAAENGLKRVLTGEMKGTGTQRIKAGVATGNTTDNLDQLRECDLVIEAVFEDITVKRNMTRSIFDHCGEHTIVGTNTSNISIGAIGEVLSEAEKQRFLGIHFFNPVRYMKLVEIIPAAENTAETLDAVRQLLTARFGKQLVLCKDTPGFIANRVGSFAINCATAAASKAGYSVAQTDQLTGQLLFRPSTGTFKLMDIVGVDIVCHTIQYLQSMELPQWEKPYRRMPALLTDMIERKQLGAKTRGGFYKKEGKTKLMWDYQSREYTPQQASNIPLLSAIKDLKGIKKLDAALVAEDETGAFVREVFLTPLWFAMMSCAEICNSFTDVDKAMRHGYNWSMGPFELCDALGASRTLQAIRALELPVPAWAEEKVAQDGAFYKNLPSTEKAYLSVQDSDFPVLLENDGARLVDIGDGIACYTFKTKANSFTENVVTLLTQAVDLVEHEGRFKGLVVRNYGANFSVGANLQFIAECIKTGQFEVVEQSVQNFQNMNMRVKFSKKPVVVAVQGRCLGGGCELMLHAARVCAAPELYAGLVETGVGLVPGGGGCKELLFRGAQGYEYGMMEQLLISVDKSFMSIALASVSQSAQDAQEKGFLRSTDRIVPDEDDLLNQAKQEAIRLYDGGYLPPVKLRAMASGENGYTHILATMNVMRQGNYITDYDAVITEKLARIFSGGDALGGETISEEDALALECEAFLALCHDERTIARIEAMLTSGKPLRN